jgi:mRNA-degrading endonuclease RelE of RelBE toxin-antitoxin system
VSTATLSTGAIYTRLAYRRELPYHLIVKAVFVELPPFERHRADYLDDDAFLRLQRLLMLNPEAGDVIPGTGGLRKLRFGDERRGKGKRGGLRVIYYWWDAGSQFWLFTVFDKDDMSDLTANERKALKEMIKHELEARRKR